MKGVKSLRTVGRVSQTDEKFDLIRKITSSFDIPSSREEKVAECQVAEWRMRVQLNPENCLVAGEFDHHLSRRAWTALPGRRRSIKKNCSFE
jgi:hypothetical protein